MNAHLLPACTSCPEHTLAPGATFLQVWSGSQVQEGNLYRERDTWSGVFKNEPGVQQADKEGGQHYRKQEEQTEDTEGESRVVLGTSAAWNDWNFIEQEGETQGGKLAEVEGFKCHNDGWGKKKKKNRSRNVLS